MSAPDLSAIIAALREHPLHERPGAFSVAAKGLQETAAHGADPVGWWLTRVADLDRRRPADRLGVEMSLVRVFAEHGLAATERAKAELTERWPEPTPYQARVLRRLEAVRQLHAAREAGRIEPRICLYLLALVAWDRPPAHHADLFRTWLEGREVEVPSAAEHRHLAGVVDEFAPAAELEGILRWLPLLLEFP